MSDEILIQTQGLKKVFCRSLNKSLFYGVVDIIKDLFGFYKQPNSLRPHEFWALKGIDLTVKRGECVGLIGPNGSGKSTLLKILHGIILPDGGDLRIQGTIGALIEVGAGFHPLLSGRENIFISGAILGMPKKEIEEKFDEIVSFAELEDSIDMPVKYYSSGMYIRLGFAIAAQTRPDVLILDEILAVGDMAFRAKCFRHIANIRKQSAIILVSHNMSLISRTCDRVIYLNNGEIIEQGTANEMVKLYRTHTRMNTTLETNIITQSEKFESVSLSAASLIEQHDDLDISIAIALKESIDFTINLGVFRQDEVKCFSLLSKPFQVDGNGEAYTKNINLSLKEISLNPGVYYINLLIRDSENIEVLSHRESVASFTIVGDEQTLGIFKPNHDWQE